MSGASQKRERQRARSATPSEAEGEPGARAQRAWSGLGAAVLGVAAMTAAIALVPGANHIANISMLYLLVVIGVALGFGSGAAVVASVLAFLAFNFFFVDPRHTFTVQDPAEWLALVMFLVTATVTGQLTARLRFRAEEAARRERQTTALAEASWAVAAQVDRARALSEVLHRLAEVVRPAAAAIIVRGPDGAPGVAASLPNGGLPDFRSGPAGDAIALVLEQGRTIGWEADRALWRKALAGSDVYLPLATENRVQGVLYLRMDEREISGAAERRIVSSLANHAAVALERERLARAETAARALAEADRLKTALLNMVSHDFRSPLSSIIASVTTLLQEGAAWDPETQRELLRNINQAADRLNRMVGNILALSRLEADAWRPQCEATALEEVVGAVLDSFSAEEDRRIEVSLDPELSELWVDPVQIVQVLHNLVDNALKYSPAASTVELRVFQTVDAWVLEVLDRGPGIPPGDEERIFDRFYRAPGLRESAVPGVGIGLAVCRGLVQAHGGQLSAANREGGGAVFRLTLPKGEGRVLAPSS